MKCTVWTSNDVNGCHSSMVSLEVGLDYLLFLLPIRRMRVGSAPDIVTV